MLAILGKLWENAFSYMEDFNLKDSSQPLKMRGGLFILAGVLIALLIVLLYPAFRADTVQFSNDGPYGVISSDVWKLPGTFLGQWNDLNWLGNEDVAAPPNVTNLIRLTLGTLGFAKFDAFLATLFAGICGGLLFRALGGNWWVCAMGGLAVGLNSNNFSNACWGLGSRPLCFGGAMLALGMITLLKGGKASDMSLGSWLKVALAGVGAGLSIMEGYDLGAILCVYIALYMFFVTLENRGDSNTTKAGYGKLVGLGIGRVCVIALITAITASYSLSSLKDTQVKDVGVFNEENATESETANSARERWEFSTQWSLPKIETLRMMIPGLMGYRMDSPDGQGYWGSVGESPGYQAGGAGMPRFSGSGEYAGVLVLLLASWAVAYGWRRKYSNDIPFSQSEMRHIKFWSVIGVISLLLAYGRYAPFYQLVYITPVFGMFRNPIKYLVPCHISILILFGYAMIGLCRKYLSRVELKAGVTPSWGTALALGWRRLYSYDRRWVWGVLIWTGLSVLGLLLFISSQDRVVAWMQKTGIELQTAQLTFAVSMWEVLVYIALLLAGLLLMALVLGRQMSGKQMKILCFVFLAAMVVDFYHANRPWVVFYNYQERLQKDDMISWLTARSKTGRVTCFPAGNQYAQSLRQLYTVEWMQHEFPHYNIPTLESWMEPRKTLDKIVFEKNFSTNIMRYWELTSARYLLGIAGVAEAINESWDPEKRRFAETFHFTMEQTQPPRYMLANTNHEGPFSIIEFSGAVPRLALYSHWEMMPSDEMTLAKLNDLAFDPMQTLLVEQSESVPLCSNPAEDAAALEYESYSPLKFSVDVKGVSKNSILLVNDRFNPKWKAFVDGKPAEILRCNYIARGLYLTPGDHHIEMRFEQSTGFFFLSLLFMVVGLPTIFVLLRKSHTD